MKKVLLILTMLTTGFYNMWADGITPGKFQIEEVNTGYRLTSGSQFGQYGWDSYVGIAENATTTWTIEASGDYFVIRHPDKTDRCLGEGNNGDVGIGFNDINGNQTFRFDAAGDGTFYIYNVTRSKWMCINNYNNNTQLGFNDNESQRAKFRLLPGFTATDPESLADGWYQIKWITTNGASDYTDAEVEGKFVTNYPGDVTVNNKKYSLFLGNAPATLDEHAKTFVYLEGRVSDDTAGSHGNLRSANGHYITRTGESSTTKPDVNYIIYVSKSSFPNNSTITSSTSGSSRISLEPQGKNAIPYIGQTNSTEKFPMVQFSPVNLSSIGLQAWTVNFEVQTDITIEYKGSQNYGIDKVYDGGKFFFAQGVTPNASDFTINGTDSNYDANPVVIIDSEHKIIKITQHANRDINVPDGHNGYVGYNTNISDSEWKTQEYWSLSDNWNNYGPGCSVSGSAQGMWKPIYLQGITGGTVPALDGWNFRMVADNSTYTIASVGKIQFGDGLSSYLTLKNTSVVTMNMGSGQANPFIVNLDEGTDNELNFVMSNGFNSEITVNYGTVSEDMNRKFNASGTGTISTLNLNATIEGTIESDELTCHSVVLGRINSTPTDNITAANFTQTTGVLEATNDNIGKYSVVKDSNGDVTLYWVTGPLLTVLTNAYAGARNINDGFLTVNDNSSTISKKDNGDIVIYNESGFNTKTDAGSPLTTISFRITLDTPTSFTKIFTYSVTNDWTTEDGKVGIGLTSERKLKGLWNGSEWSPSTGALISDVIPAGTHIITVALGQSDNSNGTRIYVDNKSTYYSATGLKTSYATYKYILINSTIANNIDALYVYKSALTSTAVGNVMSAINELPTPTTFPDNSKSYIIKGHVNNNLNVYYNGTNDYVCISNTSGNTDNYKWAVYTVNGKSFLYNIGAKKFVCQVSGTESSTSWPLKADEAYDMTLTKHENTNQFNYYTIRSKFCKGNQDYLHHNNTYYTYGSTNWSDDADDSKWRIIEVGELNQDQQQTIQTTFENAHLSDAQVTTAKGNINSGVGYPKTTTTTYQTIYNLSNDTKLYNSENKTVIDIDNIITAYKEETDVKLPEDGKAYYIINGQCNESNIMEPNKYVLYNNNNKMTVKAYSTTPLDESCKWIVRKIDEGYYALVSATGNGGYIHWTNNNDEKRSLATAYSEENSENKTKMHIAKIVHDDTNVIPTNDQLFGYLSLRGFRADRENGSDSPIIFKGAEAAFDATVEDIVRYTKGNEISQFSTAVQFVEATDYTANQVSLKAPKKTDGKTYSSIYLPYPVKVPEGVTAYYCTLNENSLHLEDIGEKIPAQTGAILVGGTEASTQTLVPATTETASENVSDNVLSGVLSNTLTSNLGSRIYVLNGGQSAGIGFYPYSQSATLTAYKAYYNASAQGARDFYLFGSDDSATGIEGLSEDVVDNQNETFDNTRKVLLDGKVVIVRNGKKYSITGQIYK